MQCENRSENIYYLRYSANISYLGVRRSNFHGQPWHGRVKSGSTNYVSSYITPDESIKLFTDYMDKFEDTLCEMKENIIALLVLKEWGMDMPDSREKWLEEWHQDKIVLSIGTTISFHQPGCILRYLIFLRRYRIDK